MKTLLRIWNINMKGMKIQYKILEGTVRYAGLLLAPVEGFWPSAKALFAFVQSFFGPRP